MKPASPVLPWIPVLELRFGANQPEYEPLPAIRIDEPEGAVLTRWELSDDDRARLLAGGSIYLQIQTFGMPLQPVLLSTEPPAIDILTPNGIQTIQAPPR